VDGANRHVDVFEDDRLERHSHYWVDSDMWGDYWWDISAYPVCEAPEEPDESANEPDEPADEPEGSLTTEPMEPEEEKIIMPA